MDSIFRNNKKYLAILLLVLLVGIFLRTYNFSHWVRFNDDQARDATWARGFFQGHRGFPLIGPKAGSTEFRIGPAYYYLQYASAFIFGYFPDKLAYPDLFFSVLTIPLLLLFLRKYFSLEESIISTILFSVSYYVVEYSRFAWNPNSMPFFSILFLYAILELVKKDQKRKNLWAVVAGVTLGVGFQLHVLFMIIVPLVAILFFAYALRNKMVSWKIVLIIIGVALVANIPQAYLEIQTGGANARYFLSGITDTSSRNSTFVADLFGDGVCHVRENAMIISSFGNITDNFIDCHFIGFQRQITSEKNILVIIYLIVGFALSVIFSLGGYYLFWHYIKREGDLQKKIFLKLLAVYSAVSFLVLGILATMELTSRYFLIVEFMPFVLFALWVKLAREKFKKKGILCVSIFALLLVLMNLYSTQKTFAQYSGADLQDVHAPESVTLEEQQFLADYMLSHDNNSPVVILDDRTGDLFGLRKALMYFDGSNIDIKEEKPGHIFAPIPGVPYFSIDIADVSRQQEAQKINLPNYHIAGSSSHGRVAIFEFEKN
jgi:4-amino-4-deoxy-L-arabinose transferase-like glycosyltransferase